MIGLRAFEPRDAHRVASWIDSLEALITWSSNAGLTWPFDPGQLTDFQAANPSCRFHIAIDSDGQPVGQFRLRTEPSRQSVRLGMVLVSPEARGHMNGWGSA
ncbi:hypothetical protein [Nonomuraea sp. B19D2]|uniref:GNAT family N-acetyltransferase n=1 Tax=Nonomuraea sp. B19D2 TaxID=3159561 RepID=UPI0032DA75F4